MKPCASAPDPGVAVFHFVSVWRLPASPQQVWQVMADVEEWPTWWPGITAVTLDNAGDADGLGRRGRVVVRSPLGHALRFEVDVVATRRPHEATARVTGELEGSGSWTVEATDHGSTVTIGWDVDLLRPGLRLLARPLAWPMGLAHRRVMAAGERALAERLRRSNGANGFNH